MRSDARFSAGDRIAHSRHRGSRKPQVSLEPEDQKQIAVHSWVKRGQRFATSFTNRASAGIYRFLKIGEQAFSNEILPSLTTE